MSVLLLVSLCSLAYIFCVFSQNEKKNVIEVCLALPVKVKYRPPAFATVQSPHSGFVVSVV